MSRLPRDLEHLKTGFTAEAVSAARYRAYAAHAESEGLPNLARRWRDLAAAKDDLAVAQLRAAGQVRGGGKDLSAALAEERYENDVLYPKLLAATAGETRLAFERVVEAQRRHLEQLEALRGELTAARGDVAAS